MAWISVGEDGDELRNHQQAYWFDIVITTCIVVVVNVCVHNVVNW